MDVYFDIVRWIDSNIISGLFISVLVLILGKLLVKGKLNIVKALQIIKWIIVPYSITSIIYITLLLLFPSEKYNVINRATGPYWWVYWLMIISNCVLPLTLLWKKFSVKIYYVFAITILMNLGWLFESYVIHVTSIQMDFAPWTINYNPYLPFPRERIIILNGIVSGIVILIAANIDKFITNIKSQTTQN